MTPRTRPPWRAGLLLLMFLLLATTLPVSARVWRASSPERAVACRSVYVHENYADVTLSSGRLLSLRASDIDRPEECIPSGTLIEKKRGQYYYTINGVTRPTSAVTQVVAVAPALAVVLLFVVAVVERRRRFVASGR